MTAAHSPTALTRRPLWPAVRRGLLCRCPRCGDGRLYGRFLKVVPACAACGELMDGQHRADDAPPWMVMFVVGHLVVALNLVAERNGEWPLWWHYALWPALSLVLCVALLPPFKGAMIGYQWALRLHGFERDASGSVPGRGAGAVARDANARA